MPLCITHRRQTHARTYTRKPFLNKAPLYMPHILYTRSAMGHSFHCCYIAAHKTVLQLVTLCCHRSIWSASQEIVVLVSKNILKVEFLLCAPGDIYTSCYFDSPTLCDKSISSAISGTKVLSSKANNSALQWGLHTVSIFQVNKDKGFPLYSEFMNFWKWTSMH